MGDKGNGSTAAKVLGEVLQKAGLPSSVIDIMESGVGFG